MNGYFIRLAARNALRHPLRTALTAFGLMVALMAFGLLRTTVDAWYAGVEASSASRLVVRNKNSLMFQLPLHYGERIRKVDGVKSVSHADWFGGIYIDRKNFFPQFAIEPEGYLSLYPEFVIPPESLKAFLLDRRGALAGRRTVEQYGWKVGDTIPLMGTIYAGDWQFVLRGVYEGSSAKVDESQFFFHWEYLNETLKKSALGQVDQVGIFLVGLDHPEDAALVAQRIDALFANSNAETLTETEKAFQLGFVAMTEAILLVIQAVSFLVILIIMAVMANTMAMTARERQREYATLKALGFGGAQLAWLIFGESLLIAVVGGVAGILLTYPAAGWVGHRFGTLFPIFAVSRHTVVMAGGMALLVGVIAALVPAWRAMRMPVHDGLRAVG